MLQRSRRELRSSACQFGPERGRTPKLDSTSGREPSETNCSSCSHCEVATGSGSGVLGVPDTSCAPGISCRAGASCVAGAAGVLGAPEPEEPQPVNAAPSSKHPSPSVHLRPSKPQRCAMRQSTAVAGLRHAPAIVRVRARDSAGVAARPAVSLRDFPPGIAPRQTPGNAPSCGSSGAVACTSHSVTLEFSATSGPSTLLTRA